MSISFWLWFVFALGLVAGWMVKYLYDDWKRNIKELEDESK